MKLSIIIPTYNRIESLKCCLSSLREFTPTVSYEIIVIDGGSDDGTAEWLCTQKHLIILQHNARLGCVKAFNDGFRISRGEYCAQLSDDVVLVNNCLDEACRALDENPLAGQVMIKHTQGGRLQGPQFKTDRGSFLFVAFGLTRRTLGDQVGWWGDYYHQRGDTELSLKVCNAGYTIEILPDEYHVLHEPGPSELRIHKTDARLFAQRWSQWEPSSS